MLQAMRNKMHGWPSIIVLGVAVLAMSLFGMQSYFESHNDTNVATVGKHDISQGDFQDRMNSLRQQASAREGDKFDSSIFEKPEVKQQVVDAMVDEQLLLQANSDWGIRVSDQAVRDAIASQPSFQQNGHFDPSMYRSWLADQRKSPEMLENQIRSSMALQALPDAINASTIVSNAQVDQFLGLATQRRDLSYVVLPAPKLSADESKVTDAQIASYYKKHLSDYMNPEQVSIKYIQVDGAKLKPDAAPSEEDLKKRYEKEKQRFVQPEQRQVSHILIDVPKNATPAQQKAALAKADKIAAEATPADFAKLARKDSQDLGSKQQGGDLGWLEKGVTNAAFESAMFSLKKGQISKPILSPDGYHIIWLRDVRSGTSKPFSEVRDQLVEEATSGARGRKYNEVAGKLRDDTYQSPSSLEPAASALGLPIQTTGLFSRTNGKGLTANPKLVKAAFSDDVLVQGNNSDLIELGSNDSAVIRVDKHVEAVAKPLAQVSDQIHNTILDQRVAAASKQEADAALARLHKGESLDKVAASLGASVKSLSDVQRDNAVLPESLQTQAFVMPHPAGGKAQFAVVDMKDGAYALLAVNKVQDGDLSKVTPEQRTALRRKMEQAYAHEAQQELIQALKGKTKVVYNKSLL